MFSNRQLRALSIAVLLSQSFFACAAVSTHQTSSDSAHERRIDMEVQRLLDLHHTPGASVEAIHGGRIVYARAFGLRDVARRLPANVDTHYEIGSITKQFTAAAILQLQEAGKLSIDSTLATYLPRAPHASEVTLRQLLSHTSGIPDYFESCEHVGSPITSEGLTGLIAAKPLDFAPGTRWSYSNTGYVLLGRVIEVVSGEPYKQYIRSHMLRPAGMTQTYTISDQSTLSDASGGYAPKDGAAAAAPPLDESFAGAAGDLVSTIGDVQKWNSAITAGRIVTPRSFALMTISATTLDGKPTKYGFGFFVDSLEDQPRLGHTGHSCGFAAENEYFPEEDLRIVVLTNAVDGPAESIVTVLLNLLAPEAMTALERPGGGEDSAMTARIKAFAMPLFKGHVVRAELTDEANRDLTDDAAAAQFGEFGEPTAFIFKRKIDRNFGPVYIYWLKFGDDVERLLVQVERKTNKFHVVQVTPPSEFGAKR
jgi:D-alanyl-D-alanine carboxypeptidase